ncbi:MAG: lytic transglycosylase domain-containing protein [Myxococcota bacterium]
MGPFAPAPLAGAVLLAWLLSVAPAAAQIYVYTDESGVMHFSDVPRHAGFHPYSPAIRPGRRGVVRPRGPRAWDGVIRWAGRSHGLSPALVKAVVHTESLFDPLAISLKGALGLMQLMPDTADALGVDDPFDPWQNIEGGTRYLSYLILRFHGDLSLGLAAYHAGERAVRRYSGIPPFPETRRYVSKVLTLYRHYDADFR